MRRRTPPSPPGRPGRPGRGRALRAVAASTLAAALAVAGLVTAPGAALAAAPAQTTFVAEGFTGPSAGAGYVLPRATTASNVACLTAGTGPATAESTIPGCAGSADAPGQGALRLTTAQLNETGGVGSATSVPITKGIDAVFNSYQYNGRNDGAGTADGIVFYLAATDPYDPKVPTQIGQLGGSLGYSSIRGGGAGLANAYLGVGLDRYGNFVAPGFGGSNCPTSSARYPNNVTVRGPGTGNQGYCVVATTAGTAMRGSLSATGVTDRATANVPVQIVINPTSGPVEAAGDPGRTVAPGTFTVWYTPIGGERRSLSGTLPKLATSGPNAAGIPSSWIDPTTGYPYKLTYGWVAGTGGASDVHEVNHLTAQTAAGPVPVLTATTGGATSAPTGGDATWTLTPTVSEDGGTETQLVRATTVFPTGTTPRPAAATGDGWSCSATPPTSSGTTVTCDHPVAAGEAIQPGTALSTLSVPYTVTGQPRRVALATTIASTDAEAVKVSHPVDVTRALVTVAAPDASATHGGDATFRATVASTASGTPTGTVVFTDATSGAALCAATVVDGTATCAAPAGPVGERRVLVSYDGDAAHAPVAGADRPALTLTVARAATGIALVVDPDETAFGTPTRLSARGLPADATGTVEFLVDGAVACTTTLPVAACDSPASLAAGAHEVVARWSGDASYLGATSAPRTLTVSRAATTVEVPTTGPDGDTTVRTTHGDDTELTTSGLPEGATGTVDFVTDDGTVLCTATLPDTGCTVPGGLPGGEHTVRAVYSGDRDHEGGEGAPFTLLVEPEATPLAPEVGPDGTVAGTVGEPLRLAVTGIPSGATGTVTFTDADGAVLCTVELPGTGCDVTGLPAGPRAVTARYSGDASHAAAETAVTVRLAKRLVEVAPTGPALTATAGQRVRLTVPTLPEGATGTVAFSTADGTVLCAVELPGTSCEASAPAVCTWPVTVTYGGDATFAAASSTFDLVVAAAPVVVPSAGPEAPVAAAVDRAPAVRAASGVGALAFTGASSAVPGVLAAALLMLAGLGLVGARRVRRVRTSSGVGTGRQR